jgi:hypothetical protein
MAKQIKDTNVIRTRPVELDHLFPLPTNLIDASQKKKAKDSDQDNEALEAFSDADFNIIDAGMVTDPNPFELIAPEGIQVISQTARVLEGGGVVVDVLLDIGDPMGATSWDIRITKSNPSLEYFL